MSSKFVWGKINKENEETLRKTIIERLLFFNIFISWPGYEYLTLLVRLERCNLKQLWREYYNTLPVFDFTLKKLKEEKEFLDKNNKLTIGELQHGKEDLFKRRRQDLHWLTCFNP